MRIYILIVFSKKKNIFLFFFFIGNDDSFSDVNNESRMRNDGQIFGSGFHNTEERQVLGVAPTEADVYYFYLAIKLYGFRFMQNSENNEAINIMFRLKKGR